MFGSVELHKAYTLLVYQDQKTLTEKRAMPLGTPTLAALPRLKNLDSGATVTVR